MPKQEEKTKVVRPFCLELQDARVEIMAAISKSAQQHGIPFYLLKDIIADALRQVENGARVEIEKRTLSGHHLLMQQNRGYMLGKWS